MPQARLIQMGGSVHRKLRPVAKTRLTEAEAMRLAKARAKARAARRAKAHTMRRRPESLEEAAFRRRTAPEPIQGRLPRNVGRFNYWLYPSINRWAHILREPLPTSLDTIRVKVVPADPLADDRVAHELLRDEYVREYADGDPNAIFQYVGEDTWAFRAAWVVEQIEIWWDKGELKKLHQLMRAYTNGRGRTRLKELAEVVRRDQAAFRWIAEGHRKGDSLETATLNLAGKTKLLKFNSLKIITRNYRRLYTRVVPVLFTHDEFFTELARMASRLKPAQGNTQGSFS